jgi:hypothetical protein
MAIGRRISVQSKHQFIAEKNQRMLMLEGIFSLSKETKYPRQSIIKMIEELPVYIGFNALDEIWKRSM